MLLQFFADLMGVAETLNNTAVDYIFTSAEFDTRDDPIPAINNELVRMSIIRKVAIVRYTCLVVLLLSYCRAF